MQSKFSLFAKNSKEVEARAKAKANTTGEQVDTIPAKDKNPDDLEIQ